MKAWINHFALNLGSALACLYYAVIPPRWTGHTEEDMRSFLYGIDWMGDKRD